MKINSNLVKQLRATKNWSQEQLSEACGLSLRTVQRLENGGNASIESVRLLATALGVDPNELTLRETESPLTPVDAVKIALSEFTNFSGTATRFEYWWFLLFVTLVLAISTVIHEKAYQIAALILLLPLLATGTRRLNDAGYSPWWQWLWLVPGGQVALFYMFAQPSRSPIEPLMTGSLDAA